VPLWAEHGKGLTQLQLGLGGVKINLHPEEIERHCRKALWEDGQPKKKE